MGDALASGSEEGRGKLRKSPGISKHELIRRIPNGTTHQAEGLVPSQDGADAGNWNILVPAGKERKIDSLSSGDRKENSLNRFCFGKGGVAGPDYKL